jgi:hypothetical protein
MLLSVVSISTYRGSRCAFARLVTGTRNNEKQMQNELAYRSVLRIYVFSALHLLYLGLFGLHRQL